MVAASSSVLVLLIASTQALRLSPPIARYTRRPVVLGACGGIASAFGSRPADASDLQIDPTASWIKEAADGSWTRHDGPFEPDFFNDFRTTDTGFAYKILRDGDGVKPVNLQSVSVHYTGYLLDGKKFDSSYDKDQPFKFRLGKKKVILGWESIVSGMSKGMRVVVKVPPQYAYGDKGVGPIPPNSNLIFYMELVRLGSIKES